MDKILEALGKLLPQDQVKEVAEAVEAQIEAEVASVKAEQEAEYNKQLEAAYAELSAELQEAETVAEGGYQQAFGVISDLRNRLETQRNEFESAIEEGYEEAYQMLLSERGKNENIETTLYSEYDKKLSEMREYFVNKIDEFLQAKGTEIYEQARRDIVNDPSMVEHKVTLDKIVETVSEYITDEDFAVATNTKLAEMQKKLEETQGQLRIVEARNIRVSTENNKLNEQVRHTSQVLREQKEVETATEKKERTEKGKNAEGRGKRVTDNVEVIGETKDELKTEKSNSTSLMSESDLHKMQVLAGIIKE